MLGHEFESYTVTECMQNWVSLLDRVSCGLDSVFALYSELYYNKLLSLLSCS